LYDALTVDLTPVIEWWALAEMLLDRVLTEAAQFDGELVVAFLVHRAVCKIGGTHTNR
jgi:hypothetical protein